MATSPSLLGIGSCGGRHSHTAEISGNGRFIAFESDATNLVPGGTGNEDTNVFVYERVPRSEARGAASP